MNPNQIFKGQVMVSAFHLMKSTSHIVAVLAPEIANWCRAEAGVRGSDPLGAKRAEWVRWRAGRVTQLVQGKKVTGPAAAAVVESELRVVREHGYKGFCLFAYDYLSNEILDVVRKFSR